MSDVRWRGPEELRAMLVPIESVRPHPRNPRRGDLALIAESLERYGQTRPIVVWLPSDEEIIVAEALIVAGNHTWRSALERLGWTHIAAVAPLMTEDEALEYLILDNRTSDVATYDDGQLIVTLQRLYDQGALAGTGYTPDETDDLIAKANRVAETAREEFAGGYAETPDEEAARAAKAGEQREVKQLPLSYEHETFRRFAAELAVLAKEWGIGGATTDTVERAVAEEWGQHWA